MTALITKRRRPSAAAMLGTTIVLLAVALMALSFVARRPGYPLQPLMIAIPSAAVGVLVARSQPRNANGWLLLGIAAAILLSTGAGAYSLLVYRLGEHLPLSPLGLVLYQLWSPALALFLLVILLFPDGHPPSSHWRWAVWAYSLLCGGYLALLTGEHDAAAYVAQPFTEEELALAAAEEWGPAEDWSDLAAWLDERDAAG